MFIDIFTFSRISEFRTSIEQETPFLLCNILGKHLLSSGTHHTRNSAQQLRNAQVWQGGRESKLSTLMQVFWFWRYAVSILEHTDNTEVRHMT